MHGRRSKVHDGPLGFGSALAGALCSKQGGACSAPLHVWPCWCSGCAACAVHVQSGKERPNTPKHSSSLNASRLPILLAEESDGRYLTYSSSCFRLAHQALIAFELGSTYVPLFEGMRWDARRRRFRCPERTVCHIQLSMYWADAELTPAGYTKPALFS